MTDFAGASPDRCASCSHFSRERSSLAGFGFGHCVHMPRWRHVSALAACAYTPSLWRAAPAPLAGGAQ